ncbi:MBL fold metallo-hydrolase [Candidatus Saccharibacteria bacterium]|nr:MBL fold metallo-hydrolase [Candidatus Saccharibacteria bacterium]MCL1963096.1 MBL fold metallo-hydrolase [Candidatus Saccharibacteria bacterium]
MEIEYKGANCVVIKDKKILIVVDPTINVSVKEARNPDAVILATQENFAPSEMDAENFVIDMPGEYEHTDVSVRGIPARSHIGADEKAKNATMYRVETDGVRLAVIGHTVAPLSDDDLENIGIVDIVVIPVGGGGFTLDAKDAAAIVRQISPKIVIPTHYEDGHTKYEVLQESVDLFIKEMDCLHEKTPTLKVKSALNLPEVMTVYELSRTS